MFCQPQPGRDELPFPRARSPASASRTITCASRGPRFPASSHPTIEARVPFRRSAAGPPAGWRWSRHIRVGDAELTRYRPALRGWITTSPSRRALRRLTVEKRLPSTVSFVCAPRVSFRPAPRDRSTIRTYFLQTGTWSSPTAGRSIRGRRARAEVPVEPR